MLKGYHISPVQAYGLFLLEKVDHINRFRNESIVVGAADDAEVVTDDTADFADEEDSVTYRMPDVEYDPEEVEKHFKQMLAAASAQGTDIGNLGETL